MLEEYPDTRRATVGGVLRIVSITAIVVSLVVVSAHAGTKVLQNDGFNGFGSVACQLGAVEGEILAARLSADPGDYPFTIQKIEALVCPAGRTGYFIVSVWADDGVSLQPGTLLFSEIYQMTGADLSLNSIDLSAQNIVITSGKVRVGFELFQNPGPTLATDTDGTISAGANFIYVHPIWYYSENLGLFSDWIIRMEIQTPDGEIFTDGFESGDTSTWSEVEP